MHLVFEKAKKLGIPEKNLIRFNAWILSEADLTEVFFRTLGDVLGVTAGYDVAKAMRRYASILSGAGKIAAVITA